MYKKFIWSHDFLVQEGHFETGKRSFQNRNYFLYNFILFFFNFFPVYYVLNTNAIGYRYNLRWQLVSVNTVVCRAKKLSSVVLKFGQWALISSKKFFIEKKGFLKNLKKNTRYCTTVSKKKSILCPRTVYGLHRDQSLALESKNRRNNLLQMWKF